MRPAKTRIWSAACVPHRSLNYKQLRTIAKQTLKKRNQKSQKMSGSLKKSHTIATYSVGMWLKWLYWHLKKSTNIFTISIVITALSVIIIQIIMALDIVVRFQTRYSTVQLKTQPICFSNSQQSFPLLQGTKNSAKKV